MRRLPVFFLLDVSESMVGEPLKQLESALGGIVQGLRQDPHALETVYLSIIAFAGKAHIVVPLIELASFYPPQLPIGAGTALGAGLETLMQAIDREVVSNAPERKGDWKPIVYLLTDGVPTDSVRPTLRRWKAEYARRAQLVAITLGRHADMALLGELADAVLVYEPNGAADHLKFVRWVTQSMLVQSRAVDEPQLRTGVRLEKLDPSILTLIEDAAALQPADPYTVVLTGRCQSRRFPYLMKYERVAMDGVRFEGFRVDQPLYRIAGCYPLNERYFEWSTEESHQQTVNTSALEGAPGCPHCGNPFAFALCHCGRLLCISSPGPARCPWCESDCQFGAGDGGSDFDVIRSQG